MKHKKKYIKYYKKMENQRYKIMKLTKKYKYINTYK